MAKLIFSAITSLDGYVADQQGNFDWAAPDEELHSFVNEMERPIGTYLYGRRMYEIMLYWENPPALDREPECVRDYAAIWQAARKIVYSTTLTNATSAATSVERVFDPAAVNELKASSARDMSIGGPHLAAAALRAGLVDECHLFVTPVIIGGGNAALPDGFRSDLALLGERRFASGVVLLSYRFGS